MMNKTTLAAAVSAALVSFAASAVEFHGYGRVGMSTTGDGGEQTCYGDGTTGHWVGRLGDECDTFVELGLKQEVFNQGGKKFTLEAMWGTKIEPKESGYQGNSYQDDTEYDNNGNEDNKHDIDYDPWGNADWAFRQFWAKAEGILDWDKGASLWAGKRYYQRKDIHIADFFYIDTSGYGIGIENIDAGIGKLSVAVLNSDQPSLDGEYTYPSPRGNAKSTPVQNNKFDVRLAGIEIADGVSLELVGVYGWSDLTDQQEDIAKMNRKDKSLPYDEDGYFFTAELSHGLMGGFNKFAVQYAADSMGSAIWDNYGGSNALARPWGAGSIENGFRLVDWGVVNLHQKVEMGYMFVYQDAETYGDAATKSQDVTLTSVVLRPMYKWDDNMKTTIEVGYTDADNPWGTDSSDLYKFMVAQEWTPGASFWSRPTIRVYAGSFWGDLAEANTLSNKDGDDGNIRVGAQLEAWW